MGRRKPFTHTVAIYKMCEPERVVPCRLTERHLITEHVTFNRNTRRQVGGDGLTCWHYSPFNITEINDADRHQ
jgi:hypothetical protein